MLAIAAVAVAAAVAAAVHSSRNEGGVPAEGRPREAGGPLRAAGVVVGSERLRETVQAVGTVVANESVNVVGELSRRLVKVHATEGARVAKGDLLFELDDADLRANLAELQVRRRLAAKTVERQKMLMSQDKKALSLQAYDQSIAELQGLDAQIAVVAVSLAKTKIRAPFAGTVGLRRVSEGAWVTPDTILTTLQDTSRVKVDFTVPERYAAAVAVGRPFTFRAGRNESFSGTVFAIEPVIESETRSLLVRGIAENRDGSLFPGSFASVELPLEDTSGGFLVPAQAVVPSAAGHGVFVYVDGRAELRDVEIGTRTPSAVQIVRGLEEGETILTTNLLRLAPGTPVELEKQVAREP